MRLFLHTMDNSPLAKLPGELRNRIYELALYHPNGVRLREDSTDRYTRHHELAIFGILHKLGHRHVLALAQTCRVVRMECQLLFFQLNDFHVSSSLWDGPDFDLPGDPGMASVIEAPHPFSYHRDAWNSWLTQIGPCNAASLDRMVVDLGSCWPDEWDPSKQWHEVLSFFSAQLLASLSTSACYVTFGFSFDAVGCQLSKGGACEFTGETAKAGSEEMKLTLPVYHNADALR